MLFIWESGISLWKLFRKLNIYLYTIGARQEIPVLHEDSTIFLLHLAQNRLYMELHDN